MRNEQIRIEYAAGVKYKGKYFLAALHMNALFSYDILTDKLTFLTTLSIDEKTENLYGRAILYGSEAWFIPTNADHIAIVNLDTLAVEHLPLAYRREYRKTNIKYQNYMYLSDHSICLLPNDVDAMLMISLESRESKAYHGISDGEHYYHCAVCQDGKIFFFPLTAPKILVLDLKTEERTYLDWNDAPEAFGTAVYDKESGNLFFGPFLRKNIKMININNNCQNAVMLPVLEEDYCKTYYSTESGNYIFFWGFLDNAVLKINKEDYFLKKYRIGAGFSQDTYSPIDSDCVEALSVDRGSIIRYDSEKDEFMEKELYTDCETFFQEIQNAGFAVSDVVGNMESVLSERNRTSLYFFVSCIFQKKDMLLPKEEKRVGFTIFQHLLKQ